MSRSATRPRRPGAEGEQMMRRSNCLLFIRPANPHVQQLLQQPQRSLTFSAALHYLHRDLAADGALCADASSRPCGRAALGLPAV